MTFISIQDSFSVSVVHWFLTACSSLWLWPWRWFSEKIHYPPSCFPVGCIARTVSSPNQHLLRTDDVISCCLDLSAPSISFRINGQPVQGMFENFNIDGLFFPVVSFSAGIKLVFLCPVVGFPSHFSCFPRRLCPAITPASLAFSLTPRHLPTGHFACSLKEEVTLTHRGDLGGLNALSTYSVILIWAVN